MGKQDLTPLASIEQTLEGEIRLLIYDAVGQYPTDVSCTFIGKSELAILIEDIKTPLEEFLALHCQSKTLQKYHKGIEYAVGKRVQRLIEATVSRPIEQVSMSRKTETRWMGIFILI